MSSYFTYTAIFQLETGRGYKSVA